MRSPPIAVPEQQPWSSMTDTQQENSSISLIRKRRQRRSKYDTYKGLILTAALFVALLLHYNNHYYQDPERRVLSATLQSTDTSSSHRDFSDQSCELIRKYSKEQCAFATSCNGGDGIFLGHLIYCSSAEAAEHNKSRGPSLLSSFHSETILWIVSGPLVFLLILLFRILGSTAEEFFSPGLAMLSQKMGLPERFAGVTLLALGNGAPDVASTVNAIRNDPKRGYLLALGELTGASMVASTLIVGAVAWVSPSPVRCRGAFVRDVIVFIMTMILVFCAFNDETIDPREIRRFIGFYIAYVILVLGADVYYHRYMYEARQSLFGETPLYEKFKTQDNKEQPQHNEPTETTSLVNKESTTETATPKESLLKRLVGILTNYDEGEKNDTPVQGPGNGNKEDLSVNKSFKTGLVEEQPKRPTSASSTGWGEPDESGDEPLMVFHPHHGGIVNLKHTNSRDLLVTDDHGHWILITNEMTTYFKDYLGSIYGTDSENNRFEKFLMTAELPFTLIRMLTIPVPCEGYYCRPIMALSVALSPVWMCYYFYSQFEISIFEQQEWVQYSVFGVPLLAGILCLRFAPRGSVPPGPLVSAPIIIIGFVVSACYLDFIGDKLVVLLTFFGVVLQIPSSIMGITILAWGNASQDFIANITMARKDLSRMAITGSFAGPVFNLLIGLGISYAPYVDRKKPIHVYLDNALRSSFLFCVLNGILMIIAGIWFGNGTIPKNYIYVAAVVYFVYAVVSLTI